MIRNTFLTFPMNACNFVKIMMKNDQHIGNATIVFCFCLFFFFFSVTMEMIAKGQRGTRSHSNVSFLHCTANGLVAFVAVRRFS